MLGLFHATTFLFDILLIFLGEFWGRGGCWVVYYWWNSSCKNGGGAKEDVNSNAFSGNLEEKWVNNPCDKWFLYKDMTKEIGETKTAPKTSEEKVATTIMATEDASLCQAITTMVITEELSTSMSLAAEEAEATVLLAPPELAKSKGDAPEIIPGDNKGKKFMEAEEPKVIIWEKVFEGEGPSKQWNVEGGWYVVHHLARKTMTIE
jgi:hypothetical protein